MHGWLVDPDSQEYTALAKTEDYDTSVNAIVDADHLTSGRLVVSEHDKTPVVPEEGEASASHQDLSPEQNEKITHGQSSASIPERLLIKIHQRCSSVSGSKRIRLN